MCDHHNFAVRANVARLTDVEDGPVKAFVCELEVECADCGTRFQFRGLPPGYGSMGATCSVDALIANLAIVPEGTFASPLDLMASTLARKH